MAIKFNIEPYWDDFNTEDSDGLSPKDKYQKILFRPGHAIQARELTQLQSQFQQQISSHGDHMFKDGSVVIPGEMSVHNRIDYLKVTTSVTTLTDFVGQEINDGTNYVKVIHVEAATSTDPVTLFVKYVSGSSKFSEGASLTGTSLAATIETSSDSTATGLGSIVSIDDGIYYIKKHFVIVKSQTIVLEKYSPNVTYDVGLTVTETLVDSSDDPSLVDNAAGTPNKAAPGAHRYSIKATLSKRLSTATPGNFVLLVRLVSGAVVKNTDKTQYSVIGDTLARRTFDESGNYTVKPFPVSIKNNLTDSTKLIAAVEPSKAYVSGYEIETTSVTNININKSRDSELATDKVVQIESNNYIDISSMNFYPDIDKFGLVNIKDSTPNTIATIRIRSIVGLGSSKYRLHVFDYQVSTSGATMATLASTSTNFTATIDDANLGSDTLIFPLPINRVKTCNSVTDPAITTPDFNYRFEANRILGDATISNSQVSFSGATSGETIGSKDNMNNWILVDNDDNSIISLTSSQITIDNPISGASTVNITGLSGTHVVTLIAPVIRTDKDLTQKDKTKTAGQTTYTHSSGSVADFTQHQELNHSDILDLTSVTDTSSAITAGSFITGIKYKIATLGTTTQAQWETAGVASGTTAAVGVTFTAAAVGAGNGTALVNIIDNFEIDSGQTGSYYGHGKVRIAPTSNYVVSDTIIVSYDYFTHSTGDFFTVDSYSIDYADIPTFENIELRSAVDFRPRMGDGAETFDSSATGGSNASTTICPIPNSQFETDIQYYLNRIDKVFINKEGIISVVQGVASLEPKKPESPKDSMILYELYIPAYTLSPEEVSLTFIDNKRYTMRDIGKIEKRVSNLEYYTTLSLLETEANQLQILNPSTSVLRFKSGFLVDSFKSTSVGRTSSPEYKVGIDPISGSLRPLFSEGNAKLLYEHTNSTTVGTTDLVTIPYTNTAIITQKQSSGSINVNPYSVFNWTGKIKLTPSSDEWKDIDRRPQVMLNNDSLYNALLESIQSSTATGTVWGSWETNWVGTESSDSSSTSGRTTTTTTTTTTTSNQIKSGVTTSIETGTVISNLGDRQVSIAFRPFIRSRLIKFEASLLRPNTQVYAFFDDVDVSDWVRAYNSSDTDPVPIVGPNNETAHPLGASTLTTNSHGYISGTFFVPNNSTINFTSGQREFVLVDSTTPETPSTTTTFASSAYYAKGLLETVENVAMSTRTPYVHKMDITDTRVVTSTSTSTSSVTQPAPSPPPSDDNPTDHSSGNTWNWNNGNPPSVATFTPPPTTAVGMDAVWGTSPGNPFGGCFYSDPLAQTFKIDMSGGAMVTALDLYFTSADDNIPVSVSIRTTLNGTPTQTIIPFSEVSVNPVDVNTDGTKTSFWFDAPVYLQENIEYCFVVESNSDDYKIKYATQGLEDELGHTIIKQPYNGVMFKSQNASTWTPDQKSDITFELHRAVFTTDTYYNIVMGNEELPKRSLFNNPFRTTVGSGTITVSHNNHGMLNTDSVIINTGDSDVNGITNTLINTSHVIANVKRNSYTITIATTGLTIVAGTAGGDGCSATQNLAYNILHPIVQSMVFPGTVLSWGLKSTYEGGLMTPTYENITTNTNHYFKYPMSIKSGSVSSIILSGAMYTVKNNISPVVDLTRSSVITISNVIDDNTDVVETDSLNGSSLSKYLTKTVQLDNPSNILKVYLDTNRPTSTNIQVYYKIGSDAGAFDSNAWTELTSAVPYSDDPKIYKEVEYNLDTTTDPFTMFSIKIVFTSSSTAKIPSVRNLRAIALV